MTRKELLRRYRQRKVALGWKNYTIFGPPIVVEEIKRFASECRKRHNNLYYRFDGVMLQPPKA